MEIPILFSTPMVQAILANRKTMTRRTRNLEEINNNPGQWEFVETVGRSALFQNKKTGELRYIRCPYGQPGDILWVRETWYKNYPHEYGRYWYRADGEEIDMPTIYGGTAIYGKADGLKWRPSIHMPREAARLFLTNKKVRVERLWDISEEDALKEGSRPGDKYGGENSTPALTSRQSFMWLWQRLNAKRGYGWDKNPYVWVVEFERQ